MFGWFSVKCPVDTYEKTWTEWRMRWLADQFGIDRLLRAQVLLPTKEFFPDPYRGTVEDAQRLLDRLSGFLAVDARHIRLEVCHDVQLPGAAGHYDRGEQTVIRIAQSQLADQLRLIATLAHELAHELLLAGGRLTADVADHEWVTDLLPIFFGVGVFAANATVSESYGHSGQLSWWTVGKHGYLPARVFGYAFALFAFMRGEHDPEWASYLRLDASSALREGLRYLRKTNDSLFHPDTVRTKRSPTTPSDLADRLRVGSPSVRLAALWEVRDRTITDLALVMAATECLADRDGAISAAAAQALAVLGTAAAVAVPHLITSLWAESDETRAGAARALGALREQPDLVVPALGKLLGETNHAVIFEAALALQQFATRAEPAAPQIMAALATALIKADHSLAELLAATLLVVTPQPKRYVREHFSESDPDLRQLALEILKEQQASLQRQQAPGTTH